MSLEKEIGELVSKFPRLPAPSYWNKYEKIRYYFNKKEGAQDYTFFIDFTEKENPQLILKQNALWHSTYPDKQEIQKILRQEIGIKKNLILEVRSEFYQVNAERFGKINCYEIEISGGRVQKIGGKLAYRLRSEFGGHWNFSDHVLLSNNLVEEHKLTSYLEQMWSEENNVFDNLTKIKHLENEKPSIKAFADFAATYLENKFRRNVFKILEKYDRQETRVKIKRNLKIRGWNINDSPAISLSINSSIYFEKTLDVFIKNIMNQEVLKDFDVIDIGLTHKGRITGFTGAVKDHRTRLLKVTSKEFIKQKINSAPENELVLSIDNKYDYVASSLHPIVTTKNAHYFNINSSQLMNNLTISPEYRIKIENEIITLFQEFLLMNYNSETTPKLFKKGQDIGFKEMLRFNDGTTHSSDDYVINNLRKHGIFQLSPKFEEDKTIRICLIIAALFDRYSDFWEDLKKQLSNVGFLPQLTSEILIKDVDRLSIEEKLKTISRDDSDIIVVILPEKSNKDKIYELFKSSLFTLGFIESQFIFESTIVSKLKYAQANVVLGIIAKTGNIPYVLADYLEFADFLVGIDISREKKTGLKGTQNFLAMARFYGKDGTFVNYEIHEDKIEGETVPKIILEKIFAKTEFQNKIIMIHRDGFFRGPEIQDLKEIGKNYNIQFQFVEVIKGNVPRLFRGSNNKYVNPERNQIFYLSKREVVIVNNKVTGNKTANPLRVRILGENVKLNDAIVSVMALRMMHFGTTKTPKLPVTISFSDRISGFARRGIKPPNKSGKVPWWY
ncbi:MAG: hypothetical protein KGD61_10800 [Candidatus Lokiarchaeota archaeon]|nr:hypothetical protein [Candidatus Lokiarchaeota archaeon]